MGWFKAQNVAVVGAGIAGATCARTLSMAGHRVHVFDKSRGPGGRLATRRLEWVDGQGLAHTTRLDHGAVAITARSAAFQAFVKQAVEAGSLAEWVSPFAAGSVLADNSRRLYVPVPDMPALCRRLLEGTPAHWSFAVDGLHRGAVGWQLQRQGELHDAHFDAVVLTLPPTQAAPLLGPHRADWAGQALQVPMQPCWTLMGVAAVSQHAPQHAPQPRSQPRQPPALAWSLARPPTGPLACVLRNETRPGRAAVPGQTHWVAHARGGWSRQHLEQPATWVQQQMQTALAQWLDEDLGQSVDWLHSTVHRWRYALPPSLTSAAPWCWWDAAQGLGVCADFMGGVVEGSDGVEGVEGVNGVERAWLSAQSLSAALLQRAFDGDDATQSTAAPNLFSPHSGSPETTRTDRQEFPMTEDPRCCGSGTCIIDTQGRCWCGQQWDGQKMGCAPLAQATTAGAADLAEAPRSPQPSAP